MGANSHTLMVLGSHGQKVFGKGVKDIKLGNGLMSIPKFSMGQDAWQFGELKLHQCELCDTISTNVLPRSSRTKYHWEGEGEDPNQDKLFCPECSERYTLLMDSLWADVHSL